MAVVAGRLSTYPADEAAWDDALMPPPVLSLRRTPVRNGDVVQYGLIHEGIYVS